MKFLEWDTYENREITSRKWFMRALGDALGIPIESLHVSPAHGENILSAQVFSSQAPYTEEFEWIYLGIPPDPYQPGFVPTIRDDGGHTWVFSPWVKRLQLPGSVMYVDNFNNHPERLVDSLASLDVPEELLVVISHWTSEPPYGLEEEAATVLGEGYEREAGEITQGLRTVEEPLNLIEWPFAQNEPPLYYTVAGSREQIFRAIAEHLGIPFESWTILDLDSISSDWSQQFLSAHRGIFHLIGKDFSTKIDEQALLKMNLPREIAIVLSTQTP